MVVNTACTYSLILTFFIRAAFGIAGFGVLFTVCCASCTGVRHFKQMEAIKKTNADKNGAN
jgi:recombinational DNA repair protein (RecF pathway)